VADDLSISWITDALKEHPSLENNPELFEKLKTQLETRYKTITPIVPPEQTPLQQTINAQIDHNFRNKLKMLNARDTYFTINTKGLDTPHTSDISLFMADYFGCVAFNDQVYFYDGSRKIYTNNIGRYYAILDSLCDECGQRGNIPNLQRSIILHLRGINVYHEFPFNNIPNLVPFQNGCVKLNGSGTWIEEPHLSSNLLTWILPIPYKQVSNPEIVYDVLNQWVEPEDVQFLIQIPAQALIQMGKTQPYKKSYLLSGGRDAAKSTYLDVLKKFFGDALICSVPLQDIGERFTHATLEGKAVNVYDDLADRALSDLGLFKALTGTFKHDIERKHEKTYSGFINCVHIFSCNKPPKVPDANDEAFWSRWEYIVFPNSFERDPSWFNRIINDEWLAAFADLVLKEYVKILKYGLMNKNTPVMVRDAWMAESSSEYLFVNTILNKGMDLHIKTEVCYTEYQNWCKGNNKHIDEERIFGKVLATMGISKRRSRDGDKRFHEYIGIGLPESLKPQNDDEPKEQKTL
jgi:DNA primase/putative DNA primase/helicase